MPPEKRKRSTRIQKRKSGNQQQPEINDQPTINVLPTTNQQRPPVPAVTDTSNILETVLQTIQNLQKQVTDLTKKVNDQQHDVQVHPPINRGIPSTNASSTIESSPSGSTMDQTSNVINEGTNTNRLYMFQSLPLGASVPENIKRQIWANDFVKLGTLLPETMEKALKPKNVVIENVHHPVLTLKDEDTTISSLDLWQTAFSIFMSVYLEKHHNAAAGMLKYMEVVREIHKKKGNWWFYDNKFRASKCQLQLGWGITHQELYVEALLDRSIHEVHVQQGKGGSMYNQT